MTTGKDGHFAFDRVVPGKARIGRRLYMMVNEGAVEVTSASLAPINIAGGETANIDVGGTGRPVIGKLQTPEGFVGNIKWNFAMLNAQAHLSVPPQPAAPAIPADIKHDAAKSAQWLQQWQLTPEGQAWQAWNATVRGAERLREENPYFQATVAADGTFRIDDVPAGTYALSMYFSQNGLGRLRLPEYQFTVPPMEGGRADEELDLGVLTIK